MNSVSAGRDWKSRAACNRFTRPHDGGRRHLRLCRADRSSDSLTSVERENLNGLHAKLVASAAQQKRLRDFV